MGYVSLATVFCARCIEAEGWQYLAHALLCCAGYSSAFCFNKLHFHGGCDLIRGRMALGRWGGLYGLAHRAARRPLPSAASSCLTVRFLLLVLECIDTVPGELSSAS